MDRKCELVVSLSRSSDRRSVERLERLERLKRLECCGGCVLVLRFVHHREVKRKGREERKERRGRPTGQIASLHPANRDPARDVLLWRSSRPAPPPGPASPCTNCGSAPAATPPSPRTRDCCGAVGQPRDAVPRGPLLVGHRLGISVSSVIPRSG